MVIDHILKIVKAYVIEYLICHYFATLNAALQFCAPFLNNSPQNKICMNIILKQVAI